MRHEQGIRKVYAEDFMREWNRGGSGVHIFVSRDEEAVRDSFGRGREGVIVASHRVPARMTLHYLNSFILTTFLLFISRSR